MNDKCTVSEERTQADAPSDMPAITPESIPQKLQRAAQVVAIAAIRVVSERLRGEGAVVDTSRDEDAAG